MLHERSASQIELSLANRDHMSLFEIAVFISYFHYIITKSLNNIVFLYVYGNF